MLHATKNCPALIRQAILDDSERTIFAEGFKQTRLTERRTISTRLRVSLGLWIRRFQANVEPAVIGSPANAVSAGKPDEAGRHRLERRVIMYGTLERQEPNK